MKMVYFRSNDGSSCPTPLAQGFEVLDIQDTAHPLLLEYSLNPHSNPQPVKLHLAEQMKSL